MINESSPFIAVSNCVTSNQYTDEEKKRHCGDWKNSGLTMTQYCRQVGLAVSTLSKWIKEFDSKMLAGDSVQENMTVATNYQNQPGIEIILTSGIRLRLGRTNMPEIIKIIRAIESCS